MFRTKPRNRRPLRLDFVTPFSAHSLHNYPGKPPLFDLLPSPSPGAHFKQYTPLRHYLSLQLKRPIILESAPADYPAFLLNARNRKYDFVLTTPHFTLPAIDSGKYAASVTYNKALMADILVPKSRPITGTVLLAGNKISLPPESAIIRMAGKHHLNQHNPADSPSLKYVATNFLKAGIHGMPANDAAATIVSVNTTRQFPGKKAPVRKLATSKALPVAGNFPENFWQSFACALTPVHHKPEGTTASAKMAYPGYRKLRHKGFQIARSYLDVYKESRKTKRE